MEDIIKALKGIDNSTLFILIFAAVLLILLFVLIIVTIKVLKSSNFEDEESEEEKKMQNALAAEAAKADEDDYDDDDDFEDETSRKIREAVESVEETKAKMEAQRIEEEKENAEKSEDDKAREKAAARVRQIAAAVKSGESDEDEDEDDYDDDEDEAEESFLDDEGYEPGDFEKTDELDLREKRGSELSDDVATAKTAVVDTDKIKEELRKSRSEVSAEEALSNDAAREKVEDPDYNASFDSAFLEKPAEAEVPAGPNPDLLAAAAPNPEMLAAAAPNPEMLAAAAPHDKITVNPVNAVPSASQEDIAEVKEFLEENPVPEQKKRKSKKKAKGAPQAAPVVDTARASKFYWYNTQDIEGLTRKEDMYFKCHYFNEADEVILDLITEMYDCAFVRTEELQRIAYGITFKSLGMKEILRSEENLGFDIDKATKEPSASDRQEAYEKWCQYVNNFLEIIEISAPEEVKNYIVDQMYDYGHKDIEDLMYSPY